MAIDKEAHSVSELLNVNTNQNALNIRSFKRNQFRPKLRTPAGLNILSK